MTPELLGEDPTRLLAARAIKLDRAIRIRRAG
jgi:hypothetical protein